MPPAARVSVAWARLDDLGPRHLDLLDDRERERRARFDRSDDRDRFVLGAAVLRSLVAALDGTAASQVVLDRTCPRCGEPHGPVTTPGRPWRCSVSHAGSFAVAAVVAASAADAIGIDLETRCPPDWRDLLPRVLAAGEGVPADGAGFVATWVRKEAVLKATGEGLSRPPADVRLTEGGPGTWLADGLGITVVDLDLPTLRAAEETAPALAVAVAAEQIDVTWPRVVL